MCRLILTLFFLFSCADQSKFEAPLDRGSVSGKVTRATDGAVLSGVSIFITDFPEIASTDSAGDGGYLLSGAPTGNRTLSFSKSGYNSQTVNVQVAKDTTTANINVALLDVAYASNKFVAILTWGATPSDLDAHLWVPNGGPWFEVKHDTRGDNDLTLDTDPFAGLDTDAVAGFGPESISILKNGAGPHYSGNYRYFVQDFNAAGDMTTSGAVVRLYNDGVLVKQYAIPASGNENFWHVFDIASDGTITDVNVMSGAKPATP